MALTAKKVYAILKRQISDMEAKLNSPVRYRGTVATADLLPLNPDIGDMYNIESKSIYGEAGMNVAWNGVVWDTMGAPIDMSLYFTKEEADAVIQRLVTEYFEKNPVKPGATAEQAQQIEQNKTDIGSLKTETGSLKGDLDKVTENIGYRYIDVGLRNGTPQNSGNVNAVCLENNIPIEFGTIIELKTDRPNTEGYTYYYGNYMFDANNAYLTEVSYPDGAYRMCVPSKAYKNINFVIVERNENGDYNPLRITDFDGYSVWIKVIYENNVESLRESTNHVVPILRNGSINNPGNENAVGMLMVSPINSERRMSIEYLGEMESGYYLTWAVHFYRSSAKGKRTDDAFSDMITSYDIVGDADNKLLDLEPLFRYSVLANAEYFAVAVFMRDKSDTFIPLRVKDANVAIKVNYFNDVGVANLRKELMTITPKESFCYLSDGGKFTFRSMPRFGKSTGRCAFRTSSEFVFSFANHETTSTSFNTLISQIGENDTLVDDNGVSWVYLRAGYALVFDVTEKVYKTVQIVGASKLAENHVPILMAWSGQFVGGLLYSKVMDEMYALPNTLFNSYNLHYDIDVMAKATEFAEVVSDNADSESFLFFTDPHTYGQNYNVQDAEYLQTVIQKYFNSTPTNFVISGGDWLTSGDRSSDAKFKLGLIQASMENMVKTYYPMLGNHDTNYQGVETLSNGALTNLWFSKWGKNYYSFEGANTKFYVFDSQTDYASSMTEYFWEQIAWFAKALESETRKHIAIGIHIWDNGGSLPPLASWIETIITGYNNKDVMEINGVTYNFSNVDGHIEFVIAGHVHRDEHFVVNDSVPVILTTNAWKNSSVCFDLIFADYTARTVDCIRVGLGNNRKFSLDTGTLIN